MQLTEEMLSRAAVSKGFVFLKIPELQAEKTESGLYVVAKSDDSIIATLARKGIVVAYNEDTDYAPYNFNYFTPCEVEVGDTVFYSASAIKDLYEHKDDMRLFECNNEFYAVVPYKFLVLRERNGEYLGLNDTVVMRPIKKKLSSFLYLEDTNMAKPRGDVMEVVYTPSFNAVYDTYSRPLRCTKVEVGERVKLVFNGGTVSKLEDSLRLTMGEDLYYVRSCDIMATYKGEI